MSTENILKLKRNFEQKMDSKKFVDRSDCYRPAFGMQIFTSFEMEVYPAQ